MIRVYSSQQSVTCPKQCWCCASITCHVQFTTIMLSDFVTLAAYDSHNYNVIRFCHSGCIRFLSVTSNMVYCHHVPSQTMQYGTSSCWNWYWTPNGGSFFFWKCHAPLLIQQVYDTMLKIDIFIEEIVLCVTFRRKLSIGRQRVISSCLDGKWIDIKTHSSELRGQESAKQKHAKYKHATTTVSGRSRSMFLHGFLWWCRVVEGIFYPVIHSSVHGKHNSAKFESLPHSTCKLHLF